MKKILGVYLFCTVFLASAHAYPTLFYLSSPTQPSLSRTVFEHLLSHGLKGALVIRDAGDRKSSNAAQAAMKKCGLVKETEKGYPLLVVSDHRCITGDQNIVSYLEDSMNYKPKASDKPQ